MTLDGEMTLDSAVAILVVRSAAIAVARVDGAGDKGYVNFNRSDGH